MKLRKTLAGIAAATVAAAAMSVAASATLHVPKDGIHEGTSIGTGMWLVKIFSEGNEEEHAPAIDYGIDVESITKVQFDVSPHEYDAATFDTSLDGGYGGGVVMSCNGGTLGDDMSRNWNRFQFWGIGESTKLDQDGVLEDNGDGTWTIAWDVPEEYRFVAGAGCCQVALEEWGNSFVDLDVLKLTCYDASGNEVIAFDGLGNNITGIAANTTGNAVANDTATDDTTTDDTAADDTAADDIAADDTAATDSTTVPSDNTSSNISVGIIVAIAAGVAAVAAIAIIVAVIIKKKK